MTDMRGRSVEDFIQQTRERYPQRNPMLIYDNGSQFISSEFEKPLRAYPKTLAALKAITAQSKDSRQKPGFSFFYWHFLIHC